MDVARFDALIRSLSTADPSRRRMLRVLGSLLLGSAFGRGTETLVVIGDADAKGKRSGRRRKARRRQGQVRAQGKRHKKPRNKHHDKPKKEDPPPPPPQLCDVLCEQEGGRCCPDGGGCAEQGQCCPGEKKCGDGSCIGDGFCCGDERRCTDPWACISADACCPGERRCPDGECHSFAFCCDDERACDSGACISRDLCCPEDPQPSCGDCEALACENGRWTCHATCQYADSICCQGECLLPCGDGKVINPETCQCECAQGIGRLDDGACGQGTPCGEGFCPPGLGCYNSGDPTRQGVCCDGGFPYPHCECASGYTGGAGCNGQCCRHGCSGTGCTPPPA